MGRFDTSDLDRELEQSSNPKFDTSGLDADIAQADDDYAWLHTLGRWGRIAGSGALEGVGALADILNLATESLIMDPKAPGADTAKWVTKSIQNVAGSQALKGYVSSLGGGEMDVADPSSPFDQAIKEVGAAAIPAVGLLKYAEKSKDAPRVLQEMVEFARKNPKSFLAGEGSIAALVGLARGSMANVTEDPVVSLLTELGVSVIGGGVVSLATSPVSVVKEARSLRRAATDIQGLVGDPDALAKELTNPNLEPTLSPAQATQNTKLMDLENTLKKTPQGRALAIETKENTNAWARAQLDEITGGDPARLTTYMKERLQRTTDAINGVIEDAKESIRVATRMVPKDYDIEKLSNAATLSLDTALAQARLIEEQSWKAVSFRVEVDTRPMASLIQRIDAGTSKAREAVGTKVPKDLRELFVPPLSSPYVAQKPSRFVGTYASANNIQDFRSIVLERMRKEASQRSPDRSLLVIYDQIQKGALDMLRGGEGIVAALSPKDALLYKQALNTTEKIYEDFYTGDVGRLFGVDIEGGPTVNRASALDSLLTQNARGSANAEKILKLVPGQQMKDMVGSFVLQQFSKSAQNIDGTLNLESARRFIRNNNELLDRTPELKTRLTEMTDSVEKSGRTIKIAEARKQSIQEKTAASLVADLAEEKIMAKIRGQKNPAVFARKLALQAAKDPDAAMGLKRVAVEDLINSTQKYTGPGSDLNAKSFHKWITVNDKVLTNLGFTVEEKARLSYIATALQKIELAAAHQGTNLSTVKELTALESFLARATGSELAKSVGVTALRGQSAAASLFVSIANRLHKDGAIEIIQSAVHDKQLMRTLMMRPTKHNTPIIIDRLRGHLINNGINVDQVQQEEAP